MDIEIMFVAIQQNSYVYSAFQKQRYRVLHNKKHIIKANKI